MLVINLNNNRSRPRAWMREAQWAWYLIHTDRFADTTPLFGVMEPTFAQIETSFGSNHYDNAQGPPKDLCMENLGGKLNTNLIDHLGNSGLELRDNEKKFRANDKLTRVQINC